MIKIRKVGDTKMGIYYANKGLWGIFASASHILYMPLANPDFRMCAYDTIHGEYE